MEKWSYASHEECTQIKWVSASFLKVMFVLHKWQVSCYFYLHHSTSKSLFVYLWIIIKTYMRRWFFLSLLPFHNDKWNSFHGLCRPQTQGLLIWERSKISLLNSLCLDQAVTTWFEQITKLPVFFDQLVNIDKDFGMKPLLRWSIKELSAERVSRAEEKCSLGVRSNKAASTRNMLLLFHLLQEPQSLR